MAGLGSEESKKVPKSWNIYKGWGVNAWDKWTKKANKRRELGQPPIPKASTLDVVSEQELDQYLKDFFTNMTRSDGTAFKKASALNICRGLAAHLVINLKCPHLNFMACHDNYFPEFQKTAYRTSKVSRKGKQIENSFDQTNPENRLWDKHFDDLDSPVGLLHAVYAFNTFVFGVESVDSHCSLVPNQYLLSSDKDGDFIKFYGNIKETKSSEDKTPIFSVEERKLYDTGESDSVYNIFKKYLKGIPPHGKFYVLPCTSIQKQAGKEKYVKGSSSSPLNLSQIQDLQEHLVSSRSYKKLHILEDFDVEKRRINLINPLFFPQQTNTTAMCATETKEISKTLDQMIMPLRMENSAEGLLQEENDDDNFHTSSSVTQKATNTSQSPVSDQIQHDMQEDEEPKTMEPSLPVTTPNVVSYTPNVMSHTQGSPNMMTATPNMMTHTPNMMTRTPRMMTDIIRRGTSNCHFNPVMKPLNIQTSTETEFTIRNPFDDQTLLLRTNVDKAKDPSFRHMENFLQHGVDPLSHHFQQLSYYHQSRYPVTVGQHVSPWDYLYTNTIASRYMDPNHMGPPAQHGHLSGNDTRGIVSDPGQAVSEVPRMVPPIAQHLTSQGYKHPSFEMDKSSGTYHNYQPHMNARDNSYTPQEIFNPLHRINPGLKGQLPYMGRTLSRAQTMNHCASLNKETMSVSQDEYSPLSGMTPSEFHNKKFTSVSHEEQSTLSGATPNEFHDLRQKCKGRGQKLSPSLASLLQQAETSDRDRMNDQMEHLQGLRQAHIVNCEQNSSVNQTIERNIRKRHASKCDSETPNKFRRINQRRSEDMMEKLDVTNNCKDQENSPQTKSAQHSETPVLKTETKNKDQKNYQQPKSSPQSVAPLLKIIQIIEDIVSSQFPRKTNPNESSVDSGTTDPADTSYSEQTTQNQESLLQEDVINNSKANDYVDTTSCELTSQNLESLQEDAPNNSKPEDFVDIPDQQQNTTESENPDQDIKLLLDFDPSLRESFHKKCEDWWMKHKSQFEMNNLLTVKSNSQSSVSKDSNNDEMSENALDENQQEQLEEDQSTDNATPTKSGYTNMSEMDGNLASDHSMCDIPACSNLDPRHSIIVRAPDLQNQNTAENTKLRDYVDNCCEADDVKCMSALYVDW
ncbi:uncharacterized protein [Argopecten irradians]|uniref:uncharacterized protein n=1 Tax=Argopecten irradians TaxID=31199 RepID=UPI00371D45A7